MRTVPATPLRALLWARRRQALRALRSLRQEPPLKVGVITVFTVALAGGLFAGSYTLFWWLSGLGGEILVYAEPRLATLGDLSNSTLDRLLMGRLLGIFAFALMAFLAVSNVVVAYGTLFRSPQVAFLLHGPIPAGSLFLGRFAEVASLSSWASAFLGFPVLVAYGLSAGAPPTYYLALGAVFFPFVLVPAALGTGVALVGARWLPALRRRLPGSWGLPVVLGAVGVGAFFLFRRSFGAVDLSGEGFLQGLVVAMGRPEAAWLPSTWASRAVLAASEGNLAPLAGWGGLLTLVALALVGAVTGLAVRLHGPAWDAVESAGTGGVPGSAASRGGSGAKRPLEWLLGWVPEPSRSLTVKDLLSFARDPAQWSQFLLFFGLIGLYAATLKPTSVAYEPELWRGILLLLNGSAALLVLATLTTRFVFPLISLEGRRFWILGLAPLSRRQLLAQKFALSVAVTSIFTVGLGLLTGLRLGLGLGQLGLTVVTTLLATVALSGLAVGLGALYPSFEGESAARIVSGLGGTLTFVTSFAFIVVVAAVQALLLQAPLRQRLLAGAAPSLEAGVAVPLGLGVLAVVSLVTAAVPLGLGLRNLERLEL